MWENDKTSVPTVNQYYPYPKNSDENEEFYSFFDDDDLKTKLAR